MSTRHRKGRYGIPDVYPGHGYTHAGYRKDAELVIKRVIADRKMREISTKKGL